MKQRKNKRFWSLVLSLVMMLALAPAALAASRFADVPETAWYYKDVESAVAQGLVTGTSATTYSPDKNLTYAEAVKLAACMHRKVTTGSTEFSSGSPWYQPYADYAKANKIITKDYDWTQNATRADYMEIFANAIPETGLLSGYAALNEINRVNDNAIPDVSTSHPQAAAIYKLYRAGILQGSDSAHNCNPSSAIRRSEVATILTRMMNPAKRISFEMANAGELKITTQPADATAAPGDKASFTVAVSGGKGPFTYIWFQSDDGTNWTKIINDSSFSGVSTAVLSVKAGDATANRLYRCEVTDAAKGKAVSTAAKLTLGESSLKITTQPQSVAAAEDEWVSFTVAVSGGKAPYTYRWESRDDQSNFSALPLNNPDYVKNADTATLNLRADANDWNYGFEYRCKITDALGNSVYSEPASISEKKSAALSITAQPTDSYPLGKGTAEFSVKVDGGTAPYSYKWTYSMDPAISGNWPSCDEKEFAEFSGAQSDRMTVIVDEQTFIMFYRCEITDAAGNKIISKASGIKLANADVFAENPQNITLYGMSSIASAGVKLQDWCLNALPHYQWQYRTSVSSEWKDCTSDGFFGTDTAKLSFRDPNTYDKAGWSFRCVVTLWGTNTMYSDVVTAIRPQRPAAPRT